MESKIGDFLQGVRNCPPRIIPVHCANCSVMDRRNDRMRNSRKPRCAEPNFTGNAVLKGVNDGGFDHENIRIALHPSSAPPFHCVCGRSSFSVTFTQLDKWRFPLIELACRCGRVKKMIAYVEKIDLASPWLNKKTAEKEFDQPADVGSKLGSAMACHCAKQLFTVYFERGGFAFYPREGETILLHCKKCRRWKKIILRADIDVSEPWLQAGTQERKSEIVVWSTTDMCPDSRKTGDVEVVTIVDVPLKV